MSVEAKNYLHLAIKDFDFQRKYGLSATQVDIMFYLIQLSSWADGIGDFYFIAQSKIINDMQLNRKTIEAAFTKFKKLKLIEVKMGINPNWGEKKKFRMVKITDKGKEYKLNVFRPKESEKVKKLEKEIKQLRMEVERLRKVEQTIKEEEEDKKICPDTPKNLGEKESLKNRGNNSFIYEVDKDFSSFKKEITRGFGNSNQPICNYVPNYNPKTQFIINSYNKLSIISPDKKYFQVVNPTEIDRFWRWLYKNQDRIGDVQEFEDIKFEDVALYVGFFVEINKLKFKIKSIRPLGNGVKIEIENTKGLITTMRNPQNGGEIIDLIRCKKWLEKDARKVWKTENREQKAENG